VYSVGYSFGVRGLAVASLTDLYTFLFLHSAIQGRKFHDDWVIKVWYTSSVFNVNSTVGNLKYNINNTTEETNHPKIKPVYFVDKWCICEKPHIGSRA